MDHKCNYKFMQRIPRKTAPHLYMFKCKICQWVVNPTVNWFWERRKRNGRMA